MKECKNLLPLHDLHIENGAKIGKFGNFVVPMCYSNPIEEHIHTRKYCCIFDVSHMFCLSISGIKAIDLIRNITPSYEFNEKTCKYTVLLNNDGKIVDDVIIYPVYKNKFIISVNSINIDLCLNLIKKYNTYNCEVSIIKNQCIVAIQGPASEKELGNAMPSLKLPTKNMEFFYKNNFLVSRTGYTGEEIGFEIMASTEIIKNLIKKILKSKKTLPAGLIARNSLRLEAGFPLHGADITDTMTPAEANLNWTISKKNTQFIGRKAIEEFLHKNQNYKMRTTIVVNSKAIILPNSNIYFQNKAVGHITSSAYSPILESCIAQGLILKSMTKNHELYVKKAEKKINISVCNTKALIKKSIAN